MACGQFLCRDLVSCIHNHETWYTRRRWQAFPFQFAHNYAGRLLLILGHTQLGHPPGAELTAPIPLELASIEMVGFQGP